MRGLVILLFFGLYGSIYSQNHQKVDSLLNLIEQTTNDSIRARNFVKVGNLYRRATKIDSAKWYALKAKDHALQTNSPETVAYVYLFLGAIEYYKWNVGDATEYYQKVDSILNKHGIINRHLYVSYADRAELFRRAITSEDERPEAYRQAFFYYNKALDVAQHLEDSLDISKTLLRMAGIQKGLGKFDEAKSYFKQIDSLYFSYVNKGLYYSEYGSLYYKMKDTTRAIFYWNKAYDIKSKSTSDFSRAMAEKDHAHTLFLSKKYDSSIYMGKKSAHYFASLNPPDYGRLSGLYHSLSRTYKTVGNFQKAYDYLVLAEEINDTIANRDRKEKAKELESKYQAQTKEKEITVLQAKNDAIASEKKNQRNLLLAALAVTSLTGIFLFLGYQNRKKINNKLRELDTIKSNFFENISHEFRTPLSLISGPIEEQLGDETLHIQTRDRLQIAQRNTHRLTTLVDQLLDLSKLESGQFNLQVQQANLATFLRSLMSSFEYLAQQNNQSYTTNIDVIEGDHWFDRDALEKIITNLISNALKYSASEEKIIVEAKKVNKNLWLLVKNSGIEIPSEAQDTIFDRFVRVDETSAGTGIGLAHTKELVHLHKGSIKAKSKDNWTSFQVEIPITESAYTTDEKIGKKEGINEVRMEPTQPIHSDTSEVFSLEDKPILLIVDDNADLRTYITSIFKESHTVHTAQNGKEGYSLALEIVPDLIITDLMMPGDSGITLTKNCKSHEATSHIPIIMLTAKADDKDKVMGIETGADAYITKPFNTQILKSTVISLQETRAKLQERFSKEVVLLPKDMGANETDKRFLKNLREVMDEHLIEPSFNAESFAQALNMSRMKLHRKLKALTGLSATEFIRSQRLKLAAEMLKNSTTNISQVGYAVGFNNHSYFTKCFKEQYGISPSEYSKNA